MQASGAEPVRRIQATPVHSLLHSFMHSCDLAIPFQLMRAESATVCSFGYGPTSNVVFNLLHIMVGLVILMRVDTVPPLSL